MHGNSCCTCSTLIFPFLTNDILALRSCRSRSNRLCLNSLVMLLAGKTVIGALSSFDCSVGQSSISRLYGASSSWQRLSACVCSWFVNQLYSVSRWW